MNYFQWFDTFCLKTLKGDNLSKAEFKAFKLSVLIFIESVLVAITFAPLHIIAGGSTLLFHSFLVGGISLFSLVMFRFASLRKITKILFITVCNIDILLNSRDVGLQGGMQYFFGVTISLPFLMFTNTKNSKSIIYSILLPVILGIYVSIVYYHQPAFVSIEPFYVNIYRIIASIATLLMLAISSYYFHLTIESNEKNIESKDQLLFQSEKMVSLGILASGIAHEINNPLSIIKLSTASFKRNLDEITPENFNKTEMYSKLEKISQTTDRISKIVSALKTYTRNNTEDSVSSLNLKKILSESLVLMEDELKTHQIAIEVSVDESIHLLGREGQLVQVFTNLIKNSIDAIKHENKKWIKVNAIYSQKNVEIDFIDSGNRISIEVQNNLFNPFFTTKHVGEGTGLGLYISRNLIESMSGYINYNEHSQNTNFKIQLLRS